MPKNKLSPSERRSLVLSALSGTSKGELAERYGVARSWVYTLIDDALADPQGELEEARAELEFRQAIVERDSVPSVTRRKKEE